jgi:hypothetical protein
VSLEGQPWITASHQPNPFPAAADVRAYIPRPATEEVLAYLEAKVESGPGWFELCGPGGVGKTLLLRLLADRVAVHACPVWVPFPRLDPRDFARWVLAALDRPADPSARSALVVAAQEQAAAGRPLTLLIDDGHQLPPETAAWLGSLCGEEAGARIVVAVSEDAPRIATDVDARAFAEPLELADVVPYVDALLAQSGAGEALCGLFAGTPMHTLALASGGVPRRIQKLGDARIVQALREGIEITSPEVQALPAPPTPASTDAEVRREVSNPTRTGLSSVADPAQPEARPPGALGRAGLALAGLFLVGVALWAFALREPPAAAAPERREPAPVQVPAPAATAAVPAPAANSWTEGAMLHVPALETIRRVRIDGRVLGAPPITLVGLPPGPLVLELELADGTRRSLASDLSAGRRHEVVLDAEPLSQDASEGADGLHLRLVPIDPVAVDAR